MKRLDVILSYLPILVYVSYKKLTLIDKFANEAYFLMTCIAFSYYIYRLSRGRGWVATCLMSIAYSFCVGLGLAYIYNWVLFGKKGVWVVESLLITIVISLIAIGRKYYLYVRTNN